MYVNVLSMKINIVLTKHMRKLTPKVLLVKSQIMNKEEVSCKPVNIRHLAPPGYVREGVCWRHYTYAIRPVFSY